MSVAIDKIQFHISGVPNSASLVSLTTDETGSNSSSGVVILSGRYPFVAFELKNSLGAVNTADFDVELQMYPGGAWHIFDNWNPDPPVVNTVANGASAAVAIRVGPAYAMRFKVAMSGTDASTRIDIHGVAAEEG